MRILKMLTMFAIGYFIYDAMSNAAEIRGAAREGSRRLSDALDEGRGRLANFTGVGRGTTELAEDSDGAQMPTRVGRGVVHQ